MSFTPVKQGYIACIRFTRTPFSDWEVIHASAPDKEDAIRLCNEAAKAAMWKPPVWWQWWRRRDSHEPSAEWDYAM